VSGSGGNQLANSVFGLPGSVGPTWDSNTTLALVGKLREQILAGAWNPAVTMGESRETLAMVASMANRISKAIRCARKFDVVGMSKALGVKTKKLRHFKDPADLFLEYEFGVKPLLADVDEAMKTLAYYNSRPARHRFSAATTIERALGPSHGFWRYRGTSFERGKMWVDIKSPGDYTPYNQADAPTTLWELTPFSFVVDWFLPVGDYLEAMATMRMLADQNVWWSRYTEITVDEIKEGSVYTPNYPGYRYLYRYLKRERYTLQSLPPPVFKGWKQILEYNRAVDAVALITSLVPDSFFNAKKWGRLF